MKSKKKSKNLKTGTGSKANRFFKKIGSAVKNITEHTEITASLEDKEITARYRREF